jgi:hypothetical protein
MSVLSVVYANAGPSDGLRFILFLLVLVAIVLLLVGSTLAVRTFFRARQPLEIEEGGLD